MSKCAKIWLITAASLVLLGILIFGGVMTVLKWDFTKLSTSKYETNEHAPQDAFSSIMIRTNTADITILPSETEACSVVCYEETKIKHSVSVENGLLSIEVQDTRKWYDHIGIQFGSPKITLYLPKNEYGALSIRSSTGKVEVSKEFTFESIDISENTGAVACYASAMGDIKIKTTTGAIRVENTGAASLSLSVTTGSVTATGVIVVGDIAVTVSTGKAELSDITCQNLFSDGSTGDISLKNVIATKKISMERDTGDVTLDGADAAEIFIETDTGDVKGSLLSDKIFFVETDTGKKEVPKTVSGGRCEIKSDTGDIMISIKP